MKCKLIRLCFKNPFRRKDYKTSIRLNYACKLDYNDINCNSHIKSLLIKMTSKNPKTRISAIEARYGSLLSEYRNSTKLFNLSSRYTRRESVFDNKENKDTNITNNSHGSSYFNKTLNRRRNSNFVSVFEQHKLNKGLRTSRARQIGRTSIYQTFGMTDRTSNNYASWMRR